MMAPSATSTALDSLGFFHRAVLASLEAGDSLDDLFDDHGYPFDAAVERIAVAMKRDPNDETELRNIYYALKFLRSIGVLLNDRIDRTVQIKSSGIFSLKGIFKRDLDPLNLEVSRKTRIGSLIEQAVADCVRLNQSHTTNAYTVSEIRAITSPLIDAITKAVSALIEVAGAERTKGWKEKASATTEKVFNILAARERQLDFGDLNDIQCALISDLRFMDGLYEACLKSKEKNEMQHTPIVPLNGSDRRLIAEIIWGDETPLEKTEWLIPGFLPIAEPTGFTGEMDTRKSTLALDIAAAGSTGRPWFNGAVNSQPPFTTLIAATEDSYASTILPRFVAAGGDAKRIGSIPLEVKIEQHSKDGLVTYTTPFSLDEHLEMLAGKISEANLMDRGPVKLVIFDPWVYGTVTGFADQSGVMTCRGCCRSTERRTYRGRIRNLVLCR
jgi:hypothetical protein